MRACSSRPCRRWPFNKARAFRLSRYGAAGVVVRPGGGAGRALALLGTRRALFLTAENPRGRRWPAGLNRRRMARMAALLPRPWLPAHSGLGQWREAMFLAPDTPRTRLLARRFGQAAVLVLDTRGARLHWLACPQACPDDHKLAPARPCCA